MKLITVILTIQLTYATITLDRIVANVNGKTILKSDINRKISFQVQQIKKSNLKDKEQLISKLERQALNKLILDELIYKDFLKENIPIPQSLVQGRIDTIIKQSFNNNKEQFTESLKKDMNISLKEFKKKLEREIAIENLYRHKIINNIKISPLAIQEYFQKNKEKFQEENTYLLKIIFLIRNNNEDSTDFEFRIEDLQEDIQKGISFEELQIQYNDKKDNQKKWYKESTLDTKLLKAIKEIKQETIIPPIKSTTKTAFSAKFFDKKIASKPTLKKNYDKINNILAKKKEQELREEYFNNLKKSASIEIFQ